MGKNHLLAAIINKSPILQGLKIGNSLLLEERKFILEYVDSVNQNIDLTSVQKSNYEAYKDWQAGELVFLSKKSLLQIERILYRYRRARKQANKIPEKLSCGHEGKGKSIEKHLPTEVKEAIAQAAKGDPILTKTMLYVWAREQGRDSGSFFSRKALKEMRAKSLGEFQIRPNRVLLEAFNTPINSTAQNAPDQPAETKAQIFERNMRRFKQKLTTDINFNAKVAAHIMRTNMRLVDNQLRKLGVSEKAPKDSALRQAMLASAYNAGPNVVSGSIINYRFFKLAEALNLKSIFLRKSIDDSNDLSLQIFCARNGFQKHRIFAVNKSLWVDRFSLSARNAYKIYALAKALKESQKHQNFTKLTLTEIEKEVAAFVRKPGSFVDSQLYKEFAKFAVSQKIPFDNTIFTFNELSKPQVGKELNYGFAVTRNGQHDKLSENIFDVSGILKVPSAPRNSTNDSVAFR
jgi:hypothetical protein